MLILLFSLFFIISEACYEALSIDNKKDAACIEFFNRGLGTLFFLMWMVGLNNPAPYNDLTWVKEGHMAAVYSWIGSIISYLIIRESIFDYIYNWVAGNRWDYIGKTKRRDLFYRKYFGKVPSHFIAFTRFCLLLVAFSYLLGLSF